ncbi:MAG: HupE/UreJ family protein [Candidatus Reddybacter sp.]
MDLLYCCSPVGLLLMKFDPGYLELNERGENTFSVVFKVPKNKKTKKQYLLVDVEFPAGCIAKSNVISQSINGAVLQRWYIQCGDKLVGRRISIKGLAMSNTDILLRLKWLDGSVATALLKPAHPFYEIPVKSNVIEIAATYLLLGTEHILEGIDHLLFVFALLLIVKSKRCLVATLTAFTFAHSITLSMATLGLVHVPQQPVEAAIALSILFLAVELIHGKQGKSGMAEKWPWLVAFVFGLLHGFGFAGALAEIGLPQQAIPLALVFFNLGVELGQLLFVTTVFILSRVLRLKQCAFFQRAEDALIYGIGGFSSYWLIERIMFF